jgi:flagellin-specific chaperone FliS/cell division protein FtsL
MTKSEDNLIDDLEKKIDEAENEADVEEPITEAESTTSFESEVEESLEETPVERKKPGKAQLIFRKILIWMVVIVIAFAGGFFVDAALRYQPEKAKVAQLSQEITKAEGEITSLEAEIDRLSVFEDQNVGLRDEISEITTHITILSARAAVADATLALEQNRLADVKLSLDKVGSTLETLKPMLNEDQAEVVENMLQRYQLIVIELEDDSFSAQTDMEVLASKLNALENTLFASP